MRYFPIFFILFASLAQAESFDRPIPQAQSATAEFLFSLGAVGLVTALVVVQRLVSRR